MIVNIVGSEDGLLRTYFGVAFAHTPIRTATALYSSKNTIDIGCTAPFLVCQDVNSKFFLSPLYEPNVREHAIPFEFSGELCCGGSGSVQASQRNQLENITGSYFNGNPLKISILYTYPYFARSHMNDFSDWSSNPWLIQLNDGLRLYTNCFPGKLL